MYVFPSGFIRCEHVHYYYTCVYSSMHYAIRRQLNQCKSIPKCFWAWFHQLCATTLGFPSVFYQSKHFELHLPRGIEFEGSKTHNSLSMTPSTSLIHLCCVRINWKKLLGWLSWAIYGQTFILWIYQHWIYPRNFSVN